MKFSKMYFKEETKEPVNIKDPKAVLAYLRKEYSDILDSFLYDGDYEDDVSEEQLMVAVWEDYLENADLSPLVKDENDNAAYDYLTDFMDGHKEAINKCPTSVSR